MERIMSARDLSRYLAERFGRDGCFLGGVNTGKVIGVKVEKGELILPIGPELERFCALAAALRQKCDKAATSPQHDFADLAVDSIAGMNRKEQTMHAICVPDDPATFFAMLNRSDDDWREITEDAVNAERKTNRARERTLKRSRRNTKNLKKKGKCR